MLLVMSIQTAAKVRNDVNIAALIKERSYVTCNHGLTLYYIHLYLSQERLSSLCRAVWTIHVALMQKPSKEKR